MTFKLNICTIEAKRRKENVNNCILKQELYLLTTADTLFIVFTFNIVILILLTRVTTYRY